ncbi:hypothetical protein KVR01_001674 [Diaporthe batatas]|uniref:uncharacterized protein n=1 Tax=Diaporthe batatas TaxID=748121 RepID=UPI001D047A35|nr:uncharacterized protein KVR01_001674 [Diaporthe batatas]KAG8168925.1 hypothetical protein KVR01_001674 [Diaporthe batatas]
MGSLKASNILIFGATGFIGTFITEKVIAAQPAFNHITIFTSTNTVNTKGELLDKWKEAGNVTVITGDVDSEADVSAAYRDHKIDTVISAFGRGAIAKQVELLRWADKLGTVKWFFPSEYGTDIEHGPQSKDEKPHQQKLKVRKFIREEVRNVQVTYVVTGPYFESWVGRPEGIDLGTGFDVPRKEAWLVEADGRIGFTTMPDVGKLVVAALQHPDAAAGKALKVNSFEVTPNQVLAEYEKQTGAKWKVNHISLDQFRQEEKKRWEEGHAKATVLTLRRIWAEGGTLYDKTDNEAIGVKPGDTESLEAILKRVLGGQ